MTTSLNKRRKLWAALRRTLLKYNEEAAANLIDLAVNYPGANDELPQILIELAMTDIVGPGHVRN